MPKENQNTTQIDRWSVALLIAMVFAHLPVGYEFAIRMWNAGHYQFFPLLILVVAYLFRLRLPDIQKSQTPPAVGKLNFLLVVNLLLISAATLWTTSFVWAISAFWLVNTVVYAIFGFGGWTRALPAISLLIFIIPLPLGIDGALIFRMQFMASQLASWILDAIGQVHFREGVVLYTEMNSYLTEEACSGVRSLFSSMAAIAVCGVYSKYQWWRLAINLVQTLFWVIVGNGCRVAIVVYGAENWTESLATGPMHEALGLGVFLFIIAMALSTDRLINVVVSRFDRLSPKSREDIDSASRKSKKKTTVFKTNIQFPKSSRVFLPVFVIVLLLGIRIVSLGDTGQLLISVERLDFPAESDLDKEIDNWKLISWEHEPRTGSNIRAEDSFVWKYSNGDLTVNISLDCPWDDWHDLALCYQGIGWNTSSTNQFGENTNPNLPVHELGYTQVELSKTTGESGFVIFSSVDRNGEIVVPKFKSGYVSYDSVKRLLVDNLKQIFGVSGTASSSLGGAELPVSAIQLFCPNADQLTETQRSELRQLYFKIRDKLLESERFKHQ